MAQQKRGGLGYTHVEGACRLQTKKNSQKGKVTLVSHHPSFFLALLHFCLTNLADTTAFHQGECQKL